jgi:hypothetical protein
MSSSTKRPRNEAGGGFVFSRHRDFHALPSRFEMIRKVSPVLWLTSRKTEMASCGITPVFIDSPKHRPIQFESGVTVLCRQLFFLNGQTIFGVPNIFCFGHVNDVLGDALDQINNLLQTPHHDNKVDVKHGTLRILTHRVT